jgi:hypothetical protein
MPLLRKLGGAANPAQEAMKKLIVVGNQGVGVKISIGVNMSSALKAVPPP